MTRCIKLRIGTTAMLGFLGFMGCAPTEPNELDQLGTVDVSMGGRPVRLWIADESAEQQRGLMFVTSDQMTALPDGAERGMIFVFDAEQELSFWMKNTIIPLDIAYVATDGTIVKTYTMTPLDDRAGQYRSGEPARFAIEVNAGLFQQLGVKAGDVIEIPTSVLNRTP